MGLLVARGAGPDGGGGVVDRPRDHLHPQREPEVGRGTAAQGPDHLGAGDDRRELGPVDAAVGDERIRVADVGRLAVVGDPRGQDRVHRGHRAAGQLEVDPVEDVEEGRRAFVHLGQFVADQQHVRGRVLAGQRRHAAGEPQPAGNAPGRDAAVGGEPAELAPEVGRAPHVEPGDALGQRLAGGVDGDGALALRGGADRGDRPQVVGVGPAEVGDHLGQRVPPGDRVLLGAAAGQQPHRHGPLGPAGDRAVRGDQGGLDARGAEVDGEDLRRGAAHAHTPSTSAKTWSNRVERVVDHVVGVGHRGVQPRPGERDDAVRRVGRAHLLHQALAGLVLLEQLQRAAHVQQHDAAALEVDDRALVVGDVRQAVPVDEPLQATGEPVTGPPGDRRRVGAGHLLDREVAGRAGQRVGRQRPADLDVRAALAVEAGAEGRHDVGATADPARHRVAAGHRLAEHGQVGRDPEVAGRTAHADPEAGDHLVEDQQRAELVAQLRGPSRCSRAAPGGCRTPGRPARR